ncbi:proclotting enzyme-like [Amblyomma americanum]
MKLKLIAVNLVLCSLTLLWAEAFEINGAECGSTSTPTPVISDRAADRGEFPWTVYLTIFSTGNARYGCGGSIITRKHVLTSAQCLIPGERIAKIEVNYGSCDLNLTEKVEVEAVLVRTAFHSVRDIGIAILLVKAPFQYTPDVKPICLPRRSYVVHDVQFAAPRWAINVPGRPGGIYLEAFFFTLQRNEVCRKVFGADFRMDTMYCGKDIRIKYGRGYFGGPRAIQSTDGRYVQIGIAANLGTSCRIGNVITRIDVFMPWIEKMIGVRSAYQNLPSYAPLVTGVARLSPFMFTPDLPGLEPWYF